MGSTELWEAYETHGDQEARDQLVSENLRLVYHVAWQIMKNCPQEVEFEELLSAGTIGLMNAIENFDRSRGLAFSTLAAPRIRGAILDDLRKRDTVPRSVRRKQREVNNVRENLMQTLNRDPLPEETAEELGIELEEYWKWKQDTEGAYPVSLDQLPGSASDTPSSYESFYVASDKEDPDSDIAHTEEVQILKDELMELDHRDRLVISLYYFQGLKLHEIATVMGLTESRISQIRSKALQQLRGRLKRLREEVA
jgi:RNA polymerase sigma factor for flagellar operon FliA